jgi:hypothetical protein
MLPPRYTAFILGLGDPLELMVMLAQEQEAKEDIKSVPMAFRTGA